MSRPLILSNGELHVGLDEHSLVNDFYYPYVGQENHAAASSLRHRIGVWVDGVFSWLDDGSWEIVQHYERGSLIGRTRAQHSAFGITLEFEDCVDATQSAFLRNIHVISHADRERDVRLYMHQVFLISNSLGGDTVQYLPGEPAIMHYKGYRTFIVGGEHTATKHPFDEFSVGLYGIEGREGTFRDAEDGNLSGNAVEHGRVDSVIGFHLKLGAHDSGRVNYWIACGKSQHEAIAIHRRITQDGTLHRILLTHTHWQSWLEKAETFLSRLPEKYRDTARNNILLIKAHIDKRGAVIASTDSTMLNYSRDAYAYCWPRDATFVLWPLVRMGYRDEALQFFQFCKRALSGDGFLMHKFQADGALGSSWHPYVYAGQAEPPIQEDETAAVLFLFAQYYDMHRDPKLLAEYYEVLVKPMADFLAGYIDDETNLPHPSYDLWEEQFLTTTYTTSIVYGALMAAVRLADSSGRNGDAVRWEAVAGDLKSASAKLWKAESGYFLKGLRRTKAGPEPIATIDASAFYGVFMFGLYDLHSPEMQTAASTFRNALSQSGTKGIVRYQYDHYNNSSGNLGNPWFVTTLWLAQYYLEINQINEAVGLIDWTIEHMTPSGVLSEQVDPVTNGSLSVAPLAWSQAEFISTLLDYASDTQQVSREGVE